MDDREKLIYTICVEGILDAKWEDWFDGEVVISQGRSESWLSGTAADQSKLIGILSMINNLGLSLLLVESRKLHSPGATYRVSGSRA